MIKTIKDFPNYGIDKSGNVWNIKKNKKLKPRANGKGYLHVYLCETGKCNNRYVHRLVAAAFNGKLTDVDVVNHIDGNKLNCKSSNLEIVSQKENIEHAERTKLITRDKSGKFK